MERIIKEKPYLEFLRSNDEKIRKLLLQNASPHQKKILIEIISNTLKGNVPLTKKQFNQLKLHKSKLRKVCHTCINSRNKIININSKNGKKAINQVGGILPVLLLPLLALAGKAALGGTASAAAGYATKKIIDAASGK